jgi:hypothetical protein
MGHLHFGDACYAWRYSERRTRVLRSNKLCISNTDINWKKKRRDRWISRDRLYTMWHDAPVIYQKSTISAAKTVHRHTRWLLKDRPIYPTLLQMDTRIVITLQCTFCSYLLKLCSFIELLTCPCLYSLYVQIFCMVMKKKHINLILTIFIRQESPKCDPMNNIEIRHSCRLYLKTFEAKLGVIVNCVNVLWLKTFIFYEEVIKGIGVLSIITSFYLYARSSGKIENSNV